MRIVVIGYSGAGKTFLTDNLAKQLNCPVMHLDELRFTRNFDLRDSAEAVEAIESVLQKNTSWIMDGYNATFTKREWLEAADHIVFLNFNRVICFLRAVKRTYKRAVQDFSNRKRNGNGSAEGDAANAASAEAKAASAQSSDTIWKPSKFYASLHWILIEERKSNQYFNVGTMFPDKFIVLRTQKAVNRFVHQLLNEA